MKRGETAELIVPADFAFGKAGQILGSHQIIDRHLEPFFFLSMASCDLASNGPGGGCLPSL